ncbi:hypothetical protein J437_LFUL000164 [Ladona fulva]|uniref:Uncharacterized protein n=1 Tax=Ladona fulva TaxID=123851 RepID=A0A8K0KBP3_LADFU|nr:hypothetical protein J437_LFUL000164 [Ladona fulva]
MNCYFKELLPEILEAIRTSVFIAIDGEFTGLLDNSSINAFDHPSVYYSKIRKEGMNFLLIQFGLCTFHYDSLLDKYSHRAFNFYVFPYSNGRRAFDTTFLCQGSSMEFLAENKFDFNKLFGEGIPFVSFEGEQKLRENFEQQKKARELRRSEQSPKSNEGCIPVPERYASYIQGICEKIKNFIKSPEKKLEIGEQSSGFVRKLIFDAVEKNFKDVGIYAESGIKEGGGRNDRVVILTKEEGSKEEILEQRDKEWCKTMLEELDAAIGFSSVIRAITESVRKKGFLSF